MTADYFNSLSDEAARQEFSNCCAARGWIEHMLARRPFADDDALFLVSRTAAASLTEADWLEAFAAHPMIGDVDSLREKYGMTRSLAAEEQGGAAGASERVLTELAAKNREYLARHGFIFIVCATGKSAEEMLHLLRQRLDSSRDEELKTAAEEQLKITELRLRKAAE